MVKSNGLPSWRSDLEYVRQRHHIAPSAEVTTFSSKENLYLIGPEGLAERLSNLILMNDNCAPASALRSISRTAYLPARQPLSSAGQARVGWFSFIFF